MQKNIVLIGFMGAGKSLVAKQLAMRLKTDAFSTDQWIVEREGRPITAIFEQQGEEYFRQCEREAVTGISKLSGKIIDCGGGVVIFQENIDRLKKNGILFYLTTSPEFVYQRVKNHRHRPLLNTDKPVEVIARLLNERRPFYEQADYTVDTDGKTVSQTADDIMAILQKEKLVNIPK